MYTRSSPTTSKTYKNLVRDIIGEQTFDGQTYEMGVSANSGDEQLYHIDKSPSGTIIIRVTHLYLLMQSFSK